MLVGRPVGRGCKWMHWCSALASNLGAPTRSSQNVKIKHADQPGNKHVTPNLMNLLPLLNRRGWKQTIFKKCIYVKDVLCGVTENVRECWFCGPTNALSTLLRM